MITYLAKRILMLIPLLFGITLITFAVIHLAPGEPVEISVPGSKVVAWDIDEMS